MGSIKPVEKVKLFAGILFSDKGYIDIIRDKLSSTLGPIDLTSPTWPWKHSSYYEKEMGTDLERVFFFFERPIHPDQLPDIKIMTNELEMGLFSDENLLRPVNIDPGYITLAKVVLASTKDYSHRIYIGKGIYAEVTLFYENKTFRPFPYTYPDYRSDEYITLFNMARGDKFPLS